MQFITDLFVAGLVAYITFTNHLAEGVLALFNEPSPLAVESTEHQEPSFLTTLPSLFGATAIPDILLKSTQYQQAALLGSTQPTLYTDDPLLAIVNVYCTFTTANTIKTTTGTGFFVDSAGVIITNAHVAQYLLLETTDLLGEADCLIRQGNPASAKYRAELLYIPPAWVQENAAVIDAAEPTGTGERDYALLYITESLSNEPLPAQFPSLELATTELVPGDTREEQVTAAGYPATDFLARGAGTPLLPKAAETTISELYTFGSNFADVLALRGSAIGAAGSSGGPILNKAGEVIGVIVTRGDDERDGAGSLRAISVAHIDRTISEETGSSLLRNISGDLPLRSNIFKETMSPFLVALLQVELSN